MVGEPIGGRKPLVALRTFMLVVGVPCPFPMELEDIPATEFLVTGRAEMGS
jgi:hypothetical protein